MPAAEKIDGIEKQTLIQITIELNAIKIYPQRETDAIAYLKPAGTGHPAKPDQIRWVVTGLGDKQEILLETKSGETDRFSSSSFTIKGKGNNTVASGKPVSSGAWKYNIYLYATGTDPHVNWIDLVDPTIEIKDDP